jgi:hypothetical protein
VSDARQLASATVRLPPLLLEVQQAIGRMPQPEAALPRRPVARHPVSVLRQQEREQKVGGAGRLPPEPPAAPDIKMDDFGVRWAGVAAVLSC